MSFDNLKCEYNQQPPYYHDAMHQQPAPAPAPAPAAAAAAASSTTVVVPMGGGMTVVEAKPAWSWAATITSIFALMCCCPLCAFLGLLQAVHAYVDHKSGDYSRSRNKKQCAWGFTITSIVLGTLFWLLIIGLLAGGVFAASKAVQQVESMSKNSNGMN